MLFGKYFIIRILVNKCHLLFYGFSERCSNREKLTFLFLRYVCFSPSGVTYFPTMLTMEGQSQCVPRHQAHVFLSRNLWCQTSPPLNPFRPFLNPVRGSLPPDPVVFSMKR